MRNKVIALSLVSVIIAASLSGCGSSPKEEAETTAATEAVENEEETEAQQIGNEAAAEDDAGEETEEESEEEIKAQQEAEANEYYEKGRADLYGIDGNEISLESAYANFEKAVELGKQEANFYLGVLYNWYSYPEEDFEKAKAYYEECGDNPYAAIDMGYFYWDEHEEEEDVEKKVEEIFQDVINRGCVEGYIGIADLKSEEGDYDAALENYNKAAKGTEPVYVSYAMNAIGYMYYNGRGVEQDYVKAFEWFEKAAGLGNLSAMSNIGWMYLQGEGVEQDYEEALEWCNKSANLGHATAMNYIGMMYYTGKGVEQDYEKALEWYEKSAELGNETGKESVETIKEFLQ